LQANLKAQLGCVFLLAHQMFLHAISLFNYKNFTQEQFEMDAKINCFVGKNGVGKTNVLDAIYHLATGKSYFNPQSVQNIKHGEEFFVIEGVFEKNERKETIHCSLKKGQKKLLKRNGKVYEKFSDHVGFIPLVIISPADSDLITEGSETRRKFMDSVLAQLDNTYLHQLIQYQKTVSQRNALLKYFALNRTFDATTLSIYDEQLAELGPQLFEKRAQFITDFTPIFNAHHQVITGQAESVQLVYESHLFDGNFLDQLKEKLSVDRVLQYTSVGIHKDDLSFQIDHFPIKKFGSQGQQKSYLIALKLAQFEFIKKQSGVKPILLFDDVFDKLDEFRVGKIIDMVNKDSFGQLFISDTHPERTEQVVKQTNQSYKIVHL
jgi:DNA replication and repair protein RecF